MANNYQSRIELIVDDIAKDNVEFKAKTIAQQNAQKTDMILSISKSIAGLNDVGQNLVLNDIEKEVRENRIDIIDGSGNINVTELTRFTSTLVKAKIDEFERQGINLRLDSQTTRDNSKVSVTETVLSVAVINQMINNYGNLSYDERKNLWDNFLNFSNEQQRAIVNADRQKLKEIQESPDATDEQKRTASEIDKEYKEADWIEVLLNSNNPEDVEKAKKELLRDSRAKEEYLKMMRRENPLFSLENIDIKNIETQQALLACKRKIAGKDSLNLYQEIEKSAHIALQSNDLKEYKYRNLYMSASDNSSSLQQEAQNNATEIHETLQEEIRQIPSELAKAGYSQEELKEAFEKYKFLLTNLDESDFETFKKQTTVEIKNTLLDVFETNFKDSMNPKSYEVLQKIARNDFGGHLQRYLTSPELLQGTFIPSLTAEIEQLERISDQEFNRHYRSQEVDLDASAAEASKKQKEINELKSNVPKEPPAETLTDTTGQADSTTDEHKPQDEAETPPVQETDSSQNMALVEQDNSFLGKIKRTMSKIKDSIKAKVSKFFGKDDKNTIEEDKTTSSEQVETTNTRLYNTMDEYIIENDNSIEKKALENLRNNINATKEESERSNTELGD